MEPSPGRFYFWGDRALYLGPGLAATAHAHHAVQVMGHETEGGVAMTDEGPASRACSLNDRGVQLVATLLRFV